MIPRRLVLHQLGRWWWKRPLFLLINCVLNMADMVTDLLTCKYLFDNHQPHWALLTLLWMLTPFFLHLIIFITNAKKSRGTERSVTFPMVFLHLPFVTPLRNLYLFEKLWRTGYPYHDSDRSKDVESILYDVGLASFYESFCEAGPQSVTTFIIFLCTGRISKTQIVSLLISLVSLTWGASRAFFILRNEYDVDPDPNFAMVLLRIFPLMLISVINSLLMWVLIWGFLGPYTFAPLFANFSIVLIILSVGPHFGCCLVLSVFSILSCVFGVTCMIEHILFGSDHIALLFGFYIAVTFFVLKKYQLKRSEKEKESVIASLCSLWVPCVIGSETYSFSETVYLTISMKLSEVAIAYTMAFTGHQWRSVFLLWCISEDSLPGDSDLALCSFSDYSLPPCFTTDTSNLQQQFRVCGQDEIEENIRLYIFLGVTLSNLLAFLASRQLHKYSSYETLYHATKTLLWIIPTTPVVHRSLLFSLVDSDNSSALENVLEIGERINLAEYVNRQNREGDTPMHNACKKQSDRCARVLMKAGAVASALNSQQETALHAACKNGSHECTEFMLSEGLNVNDSTEAGDTPLHFASASSLLCAQTLINRGANVKAINGNLETPLHISCIKHKKDVATLLIGAGANINAAGKDKNTPLHISCGSSRNQCVELLIDTGADLTAVNKDNETPLHIACRISADQHVGLLLDAGADITAKNKDSESPFQIACIKAQESIPNHTTAAKNVILEFCTYFAGFRNRRHIYKVQHFVENKLLPKYLQKWYSKEKTFEEKSLLDLLKKGFSFSFENVVDEEVDAVKEAVNHWNTERTPKCKYSVAFLYLSHSS